MTVFQHLAISIAGTVNSCFKTLIESESQSKNSNITTTCAFICYGNAVVL